MAGSSSASVRGEAVRIGRMMYERQLVVATEGNLSCRLSTATFLITPTGLCKGFLQESDLVVINMDGRPTEDSPVGSDSELISGESLPVRPGGRAPAVAQRPSSEWPLHREIYSQRPEVSAVCHGHPPWATAFAAAGQPLTDCLLPEIVATLGAVPLASYGTPGTEEVPLAVRQLLKDHSALLLANHGVVTVGRSLTEAYHRLESVERLAQITLLARLAGGEKRLTTEQVVNLQEAVTGRPSTLTELLCQPAESAPTRPLPSTDNAHTGRETGQDTALEALADRLAREILAELERDD